MEPKSADEFVGKTISGKYTIQERLGRGGMGSVYKARHSFLDRTVAVKVLHSHLALDEEYFTRFKREAQTACKIRHPNVITLHDYGVEDGFPYLAMEYIEGKTLKQVLKEEGPLSLERVHEIVKQLCSALSEAHANKIIHRDLKPDNVMITSRSDGSVWTQVLDFGISKVIQTGSETELTQAGTIFGSPRYMAPEQGLGDPIDTRADLYSLGVMIYEMLSLKYPINAGTVMETLVKAVHEDPVPLKDANPEVKIPPAVSDAVMGLLNRNRDKRFQTADEFFRVFDDAVAEALGRVSSSTRSKIFAGVGLLAVLVLSFAVWKLSNRKLADQLTEENQEYLAELEELKKEKERELAEVSRLAEERKQEVLEAALDAEKRKQLEEIELEQLIELKERTQSAMLLADKKREEALAAANLALEKKDQAENAALLAAQEADAFKLVREAEEERASEFRLQAERASSVAEQKRAEAAKVLADMEREVASAQAEAESAQSEATSYKTLREMEEKRALALRKEAEDAELIAKARAEEAEQALRRATLNEKRAQEARERAKKFNASVPPPTVAKKNPALDAQRKSHQAELAAERQKLEELRAKKRAEEQRLEALRLSREAEERKQAEEVEEVEVEGEKVKRRRFPRQGKRRF